MNAQEFLDLQDAYQGVYHELDEANKGDDHVTSSMYGDAETPTINAKKRRRQGRDWRGVLHPDDWKDVEGIRQDKHTNKRYVPTRGGGVREGYDTFDAILEYLVAEGYADTNEAALAIMANMSEEWREEILDEAVRGSGRSIADRITGNDIRGVTRGGKTVYKKPKWKDEVENKVDREFPLRRRGEARRQAASEFETNAKKSNRRLNAAKNIEDKQADGDYENPIDHSKPYGKGKSGYMEVPTDYRARKRRASGR